MLFCPSLSNSSKHLSRRHGNGQVRARTFHLWPYTWVTAGVRVLNGRMPGDLSNTVQFRTLEDSESRFRQTAIFVHQLICRVAHALQQLIEDDN